MVKNRRTEEPEYADFSKRLRELIQKLGVEKKDFARAGAIAPQTLTGYLEGTSQPKQEVLSNWFRVFNVNLNWLVAGHGDVFLTETPAPTEPAPLEEFSKDLSPTQREMLTYKRLQTELGTPKERIANGLDAIIMGKCVGEKKTTYGVAEAERDGGYKVQEDGAEFGEGI